MSVTTYFESLGAPLKNVRWSWGAVRQSDGAVFLRVWQDRKFVSDRAMYMMVTHHEKYEDTTDDLGYNERLDHVELIRSGARCFMIMCRAVDPEAKPRKIKSFNNKDVFVGGEIIERGGDEYIQVTDRVPASEIKP